jgi:hypothetical protein
MNPALTKAGFLLLLVCSALISWAQNPDMPVATISPAEILDKYLAATGGLEAHRKLSGLSVSGDFGFSLHHPLGNFSFYYRSPSSDTLHVQWISHGDSWVGHHNGELSRRHTVEGVSMINGAGIQIVENDWLSLLETDFKERYSRIDLVGLTMVAKHMAYAVRFTPKAGDPEVRYYDRETFYMVRLDQVQRFKANKDERELAYTIESYFPEYRNVGGISLPKVILVSRDIGNLIFDNSQIKIEEIPESVFSAADRAK